MKKVLTRIGIVVFFLSAQLNSGINPALWKKIGEVIKANAAGGQLTYAEYALITEKIVTKAPCNVLVFGVGNDSSLWIEANKGGKTVFLEDNAQWLSTIKKRLPKLQGHLVAYNTKRIDWFKLLKCPQFKCLELSLPREIHQTRWDIIFIDGPYGGTDASPGRMKSIYTSSKLAFKNKNVDVFVHDCNRTVEDIYCKTFLLPKNLKKSIRLLRHYHIG